MAYTIWFKVFKRTIFEHPIPHNNFLNMRTRAFVEPNFEPSSDTYSKSIRFPTNVLDAAQKAAKMVNCEFVGTLINEVLLAFLKGDLLDASRLEEIQPDNGKIQQLEAENRQLKGMNTLLHTEISLYKSEIETLQTHYAQESAAHTQAAHTPNTAHTPLHTHAHTSAHTPNTERVQEPILAVHTRFDNLAHTRTQAVHTSSEEDCKTNDDYLRKIQELENEIDKILEEKDMLQNKMEQDPDSIEAYKYSVDETFKFLCDEIMKNFKIPLEPRAMHDVLNHFITQYHEQNEISTD